MRLATHFDVIIDWEKTEDAIKQDVCFSLPKGGSLHTAQGSLGPQTAVAGNLSMNKKFKNYSLANKTFDTAIQVP